jgi:hypothetical protein
VQANGAEASVDVRNFHMEIKARNRYFRLTPRFLATIGGQLGHVESLTTEATGMIGWLPYRTPLQWELASDKLVFKRFLLEKGYPTPAYWLDPARTASDFIMKGSQGSFGYELYGPYRAGTTAGLGIPRSPAGDVYAEAFVRGRNVKVWFWGPQPFFAHLHAYPVVRGDGVSSLQHLLEHQLERIGRRLDDSAELDVVRQALAYQGYVLNNVLPADSEAWLDYRYGRHFRASGGNLLSDNDWPNLPAGAKERCEALGSLLAAELVNTFPAPVLYSADGVLDDQGVIWWLEMNSNPILPPEGYPLIFQTLFGIGGSA